MKTISHISKKRLQAERNSRYEYEDYLVEGEIEHAKNMIDIAIRNHQSKIAWEFSYNDYDSWTSCSSSLDQSANNPIANMSFEEYCAKHLSKDGIQTNYYHGIDSELSKWLKHKDRPYPKPKEEVDFAYIRHKLEAGLYHLGCKSVKMFIGPHIVTKTVIVGTEKRSAFARFVSSSPDKYKNVFGNRNFTVYNWAVFLSW